MPVPNRWAVPIREPRGGHGLTLLCLSYAGGNPEGFRAWADGIDPRVGLVAVRLPGHGRRLAEPTYRSWAPLVDDAFAALRRYLAGDHALFGHSFGGRLAYELAQRAEAVYPGRTKRLLVAACRSPDARQRTPYMHELRDDDFHAVIDGMGGTPAEVLSNAGLMRLVLPVVRAEIRLAELWDDRHGSDVGAPITALYGHDDPIDGPASMRGWSRFTRGGCELVGVPGGHFFLDTHRADLLEIVDALLERDHEPVDV